MKDWTEELFKENPELLLQSLEERRAQASLEVDFLLKRLNEAGFDPHTILDLCCGAGRHSIELAKRGVSVWGVDISEKYVEIARQEARQEGVEDSLKFLTGDMREVTTLFHREKFDGVINMFTAFGFYDRETNRDVLRQCGKLVKEEGFFLLDIVNRDWLIRNFQERDFQETPYGLILQKRRLNPRDSRMYNEWTFLEEEDDDHLRVVKRVNVDHRVWSLHELIDLFQETGWHFLNSRQGFLDTEENGAKNPWEGQNLLVLAQKGK